MGRGVFLDPGVMYTVAVLFARREPEAVVLDSALLSAHVVNERTIVAGVEINIAVLAPQTAWAKLLVGRFAVSCELLNEDQLHDVASSGRPVDPRGPVVNPLQWRGVNTAEATWELWNVRVREVGPYSVPE